MPAAGFVDGGRPGHGCGREHLQQRVGAPVRQRDCRKEGLRLGRRRGNLHVDAGMFDGLIHTDWLAELFAGLACSVASAAAAAARPVR